MNGPLHNLLVAPGDAAKFLSCRLELPEVCEVADGLWRLGRLHGRILFYADEPTKDLCVRLQNDSRAIFVFGRAGRGFEGFPEACVRRGRALSEVLRNAFNGELLVNEDEIERLAPKRTVGLLNGRRGGSSLQTVRLQEWRRFIKWWYAHLREEQAARRPHWKDIEKWFCTEACLDIRSDKPGIRTLQRDVKALTRWDGEGEDLRSAEFTMLWNRVEDVRFVLYESDRALADIVAEAFPRPGHGCDAEAIRPLPGGRNAYQSAS